MDEIRTNGLILLDKYYNNSDIIQAIEQSIYNEYSLDANMYSNYIIKMAENLKSEYVRTCLDNSTWKPQEVAFLEKDILDPDKWQKIQDIRMPKSIVKERKRGLYKCRKCRSFETSHHSVQTRSADESATIYITCHCCEYVSKI